MPFEPLTPERDERVIGLNWQGWFGTGPHETYPDRRSSALLGRWHSTVTELDVPYLRPQENGGRGRTSWARLSAATPTGPDPLTSFELRFDRGMQFSASHHTAADLETARHWWELRPRAGTVVTFDVAHRGLGSASVGPDTLPRYRIGAGEFRWRWWLRTAQRPAPG